MIRPATSSQAPDSRSLVIPCSRPRVSRTTDAAARSIARSSHTPQTVATLRSYRGPAYDRLVAEVEFEVREAIAWLTINRPERRNAMSFTVLRELGRHLEQIATDDRIRVIVLGGAGDRAFSAGADLTGMDSDTGPISAHEARGLLADIFRRLSISAKPSIARVQGFALAGGFGLALACDFVIASTNAEFGTPEINVGLWPYMITVPLLRSMPPLLALELTTPSQTVVQVPPGPGGNEHVPTLVSASCKPPPGIQGDVTTPGNLPSILASTVPVPSRRSSVSEATGWFEHKVGSAACVWRSAKSIRARTSTAKLGDTLACEKLANTPVVVP